MTNDINCYHPPLPLPLPPPGWMDKKSEREMEGTEDSYIRSWNIGPTFFEGCHSIAWSLEWRGGGGQGKLVKQVTARGEGDGERGEGEEGRGGRGRGGEGKGEGRGEGERGKGRGGERR